MGNFNTILWVIFVLNVLCTWVNGFGYPNYTFENIININDGNRRLDGPKPIFVDLTLIQRAAAKGAFCLDGTLPGYHLHRGHGIGANNWLIQLEGGGWCTDVKSCVHRKGNHSGSSTYMEKHLQFTGILSDKIDKNPDFFDWNRVKLRYCDGASFAGEGEDKAAGLHFRGQRIWLAAMEELMSKGMNKANEALLSGCSAGGLASILHCDEFRDLFPSSTKVKCISDAGLFLDVINVYGTRAMRNIFKGTVTLQGVAKNLPSSCTNRLDATSCFFPENLIANIKTPLFFINSAYDSSQVKHSLIPTNDPNDCRSNHLKCSDTQINFFQEFRNHMLSAINSTSKQNGWFINSCYSHCYTENQNMWFAIDSPRIGNKSVAVAVGDWFFDRKESKNTDCPYPCNKTCHDKI